MADLFKDINPDFDEIFSKPESARAFLEQVSYFFETVLRYVSQLFKAFGVKPTYADPNYKWPGEE